MTTRRYALLFAIVNLLCMADESLAAEAHGVPLCSSENSVCNIIVRNGSDKMTELERVCGCGQGKTCPSTIGMDKTINYLDGEWFATCDSLDTFPVCESGQTSLVSRMSSLDDPLSFVVMCTCPGGYDTNSARRTLEGIQLMVEIRCKGEHNALTKGVPSNENSLIAETLPSMSENNIPHFDEEVKRGGSLSSFYKRGRMAFQNFYKRRDPNLSAFYKRAFDSIQSFYKRAPFYKRSAKTYNEPAKLKRSVHSLSSFYKRAPFQNLNAFYKKGDDEDGLLDLEKKNGMLASFYKRRFDDGINAFYKRGGFGSSSFYKKSDDGFGRNLEELLAQETSPEQEVDIVMPKRKGFGGDMSFYKRDSINDEFKRNPWNNYGDNAAFYKKRGPDFLSSSFYKRGPSFGQNSFYKRGPASGVYSFYK